MGTCSFSVRTWAYLGPQETFWGWWELGGGLAFIFTVPRLLVNSWDVFLVVIMISDALEVHSTLVMAGLCFVFFFYGSIWVTNCLIVINHEEKRGESGTQSLVASLFPCPT